VKTDQSTTTQSGIPFNVAADSSAPGRVVFSVYGQRYELTSEEALRIGTDLRNAAGLTKPIRRGEDPEA
jgi:hypothetical protein